MRLGLWTDIWDSVTFLKSCQLPLKGHCWFLFIPTGMDYCEKALWSVYTVLSQQPIKSTLRLSCDKRMECANDRVTNGVLIELRVVILGEKVICCIDWFSVAFLFCLIPPCWHLWTLYHWEGSRIHSWLHLISLVHLPIVPKLYPTWDSVEFL